MAKKAYLDVFFLDAAERTAVVSYQLATDLLDDGSNLAAVMTNANALETVLNVLTWDKIVLTQIRFDQGGGGASPNVSANNQIHARSYIGTIDGIEGSFDVPAWDDFTYDQDEFNLLSSAYDLAADAVTTLIKNQATNSAFAGSVKRSVSRTHKSRGKKVV